MLHAAPPPLVTVHPTREVRTIAPVSEVAADGGRAATLVGETNAWEYMLVWSPKGIVERASLACDTQESNIVLAGNRYAHLCLQDRNYIVTGTLKPLRGRVALRAPGAAQVALAGQSGLVAGSTDGTVWRFDPRARQRLRTYKKSVIVLAVDRNDVLVDRSVSTLDVLSSRGKTVATLQRPHGGGALLRGGRIGTISGRTLTLTDLRGRVLKRRAVAPGARLEDFGGNLAVYSVETRMHLLRLSDGRDVRLRLPGQFGYAHARLSDGSLFYAYNGRTNPLGHAGYLDARHVRALLAGR